MVVVTSARSYTLIQHANEQSVWTSSRPVDGQTWSPLIPTFIGIDLAWKSDRNHTGAAVFRGNEKGVELTTPPCGLNRLTDVLAFVAKHEENHTVASRHLPALDLINDAMASARDRQEKDWASGTLFADGGVYNMLEEPEVIRQLVELASTPMEWQRLRWKYIETYAGSRRASRINACIKKALLSRRLTGASGEKIEKEALLRRSS